MNVMAILPNVLNQAQAASLLGVSRRTIKRFVEDGQLRCTKVGKKVLRFHREDVESMIVVLNDPKTEGGSSLCSQ